MRARGMRKPTMGTRGRPPTEWQVFTLSVAPTANHLWFNRPDGGRARTPEYDQWRKSAGWELQTFRPKLMTGTVAVTLRIGLSPKRRDLDNHVKPVLDLLATHNVIEDDSRVTDIFLHLDRAVEAGKIQVQLKKIKPPQARLSAEDRKKVSSIHKARWAKIKGKTFELAVA